MLRKKHFADYIVYISIAAVTIFTAAGVALQFVRQIEISSQLTISWFTFWTVEIVALATIKNRKIKSQKEEVKTDEQ